jgi:hypothetical protein
MAKLTFFNYWNVINGTEILTDEHITMIDKYYNKWMMNKLISNDVRMLECCSGLSRFNGLSNLAHFKAIKSFYRQKFKNQKIFIKYGNSKEKVEKEIELISDKYNVSIIDAHNYKELISDEEMNELILEKKEELISLPRKRKIFVLLGENLVKNVSGPP